ncbi:GNAT family N-acetyltransferase [Sphingobacterium corticis]|uniref:GNAT family N-acetyltransferase n=1 Tax=Sphingobacterium corticis TaxID=1812823 RepID=A0ABW5NM09_9SPHI
MSKDFLFRQAEQADATAIWEIIKQAIERRKADGSDQWQDGYPNPAVIEKDIVKGAGYVLVDGEIIIGYCALFVDDEPAYDHIDGQWLTNGSFVVFHRVAISGKYAGQGLAQQLLLHIEDFAKAKGIYSVKADTNFDNQAMLRTFEKVGYQYCGEVLLRGAPRKAFEKQLFDS